MCASCRLIDDGINVRLWRLQEKTPPKTPAAAAAAASTPGGVKGLLKAEAVDPIATGGQVLEHAEVVQQANFYHHLKKMAGPSTRFAPCECVAWCIVAKTCNPCVTFKAVGMLSMTLPAASSCPHPPPLLPPTAHPIRPSLMHLPFLLLQTLLATPCLVVLTAMGSGCGALLKRVT
jgi:hypothetical protein